jgi:hypothetical protein
MGGHAYIIPGELAPARRPDLHPPAPPPSPPTPAPLWRRLLGSRSSAQSAPDTARVTELPNGDRFFDVPPGGLKAALVADLRAWLNARLPRPSTGTRVVLDYIKEIEPTVYVRGLQKREQQDPEFYVQVTFSGCAGQAETSARAAAHWASLWYAAESARLASAHLAPYGFTPAALERGEEEEMMFLPAGELGYLEFNAPGPRDPDQQAFEADASIVEAYADDPLLERLDAAFGRYMSEARCRCQICEPEFGDATPTPSA